MGAGERSTGISQWQLRGPLIFLPEQRRWNIFPSVGLTTDLKCGGSSTPTKLSKACGGKMSNYYILFSRRWLPLSCYPRTLICQHLPCFQPHDPQGMEHHSGDEVALVVNRSSHPKLCRPKSELSLYITPVHVTQFIDLFDLELVCLRVESKHEPFPRPC